MKGLGLVVEKGEFEETSSDRIPTEMKKKLAEQKSSIPPQVLARLEKALDELTDGDFRDLKASDLIESILSEYSGE
ncbi:MAG: hypothetical protein JSV43_05085, partial [Methanobacteriota archaeon]